MKSKELALLETKNWLRQKAAVGGSQVSDFASGSVVDQNDSFLVSFQHDQNDLLNQVIALARFASLNARCGVPSSPTVAYQTSEGAAVAATKFSMSFSSLTPSKVSALAVVSNAVLQADPRAVDTLYKDLREGTILASDAALIAILKAGLTPIDSEDDPAKDIRSLLDSVNITGFGNLLLIVSPDLANALSTWPYSSVGGLTFPNMTPQGGVVCVVCGVRAHVSGAMADSELLMVDLQGLLCGPQTIDLQLAQSATIEMDTAPTGDSEAPATAEGAMVSMFQTDCSAFRLSRIFAVKKVRASSVALVNGISWEVAS